MARKRMGFKVIKEKDGVPAIGFELIGDGTDAGRTFCVQFPEDLMKGRAGMSIRNGQIMFKCPAHTDPDYKEKVFDLTPDEEVKLQEVLRPDNTLLQFEATEDFAGKLTFWQNI